MNSKELPTPAVIVDLAIAKRNINKLAKYAREHKLGIRPHTKTHKSTMMAHLQIVAGAVGLTVAKVGEADVMLPETDDLLIAYPALDAYRSEHLAELAKKTTVRVGLDSAYAAEVIGSAAQSAGSVVGVLVDIDVGHHRTGVQSPQAALELAQKISKTKGLRLDGIMCFPGQLKEPAGEQTQSLAAMESILRETVELMKRSGLEAKIVSGGSSPTAYQSHLVKSLTEIRPGTYIYNDANMMSGGFVTPDECAVRLACTVVSDAVPGKCVIDAGSKTLTYDRRMIDPDNGGFGYIVEYPQAIVERLSEEHGEVNLSASDKRPKLGERIHVIPNHVCPCINLHDEVHLRMEDGSMQKLRIDARGRVV